MTYLRCLLNCGPWISLVYLVPALILTLFATATAAVFTQQVVSVKEPVGSVFEESAVAGQNQEQQTKPEKTLSEEQLVRGSRDAIIQSGISQKYFEALLKTGRLGGFTPKAFANCSPVLLQPWDRLSMGS